MFSFQFSRILALNNDFSASGPCRPDLIIMKVRNCEREIWKYKSQLRIRKVNWHLYLTVFYHSWDYSLLLLYYLWIGCHCYYVYLPRIFTISGTVFGYLAYFMNCTNCPAMLLSLATDHQFSCRYWSYTYFLSFFRNARPFDKSRIMALTSEASDLLTFPLSTFPS